MEQNGAGSEPRLELLPEFESSDLEAWHAEVLRGLGSVPFEKAMLTPTYEGITLQPLYTWSDTERLTHLDAWPGASPFVRGGHPLGRRRGSWTVVQEVPVPEVVDFNTALRHDLERGQNAVALVLDTVGRDGLDPDRAEVGQVGQGGVSVAATADLEQALDGVDLAAHPLYVGAGAAAVPMAALTIALACRRGTDSTALDGFVGCDPLGILAARGGLPVRPEQLYGELAALTRWAEHQAPQLRTVAAWGFPYREAGANLVQELAFALAAAVDHLRAFERIGLSPEQVIPHLQLGFSVGTDFFPEIAKLRAARLLWAQIVRGCCGNDSLASNTQIHARTSRFTKTVFDSHVNLLRATTEAMAAVLGGVDSLHISPFDEPRGSATELSRRLARNTHTLLREEAHLDKVIDPAGGSWCVETLTAAIAERAWSVFQEIESDGGLRHALETGEIQGRVAAVADERAHNVALGRDVLVGVNRYPDAQEKAASRAQPPDAVLHSRRAATVQQMRTADGRGDTIEALARVEADRSNSSEALFAGLVTAAELGATLGELTSALRLDTAPGPQVVPMRARRAAEPFERLRTAVLRRAETEPLAVQVYLCCLGDVAGYRPRLDFVRGFFGIGGFTVLEDDARATPTEAAEAARRSGAALVALVGGDEEYAELGVDTVRRLRQTGGPRTILVAGYPSGQVAELEAAGVDRFVDRGSNALAELNAIAAECGVVS